jgi:uridylate kinase
MAGAKTVIDGPALKLIRDKRVPTFVVNGKNLPEFTKAIQGQPYHGTRITFADPAPTSAAQPAAAPKK